ncbi:SLATT domain-containing protein [Amycolatopsis sp. WQ 127309]|uniref:SLATT domain-containing protein n=1 Tax=Amycolatopsis sp. WQ 127309 TaxID=2932773 RepID=UPI001FF48CDF|nr:SLATT domain-containing protein [Amycolatopsis sp. WQ 127309]UOZ07972.1 SLATT domain-containing protein [Amycolatopsis sp. WQ 127309]
MWPRRRTSSPTELTSERGYLELVGRQPDQPLRDALLGFRDLVSADIEWIDSRKKRFKRPASQVRVATLALTGLSTIVLGIPEIPARASIALPLVAMVTLLGGLETFFTWRSRWLLMEETQYRMNHLRDHMDYYLVTTPTADLRRDRLDGFYAEQQDLWAEVSRRWVEFRKHDRAPQPEVRPS